MLISEVTTFAFTVRQFLEPHWLAAHQGWNEIPSPLSRWMCRYSSIFLVMLLRELQSEHVWEIVGGRPPQDMDGTLQAQVGMLGCDGIWCDHCWVKGNELIIDLTADQFGHAPVIVTHTSDQRYRANLAEIDLEKDLQKLQRRPMQWLSAWRANDSA
ncbi:hypothetical protein HJG54_17910 [Leptolyngbya sp. NK1-12]|uniref:Uncharacterized protein n=1 Tax=Leptolyngbya sp. NK1-12 TaxID=2547451 RepID=A0AA97AR03_9CYAN|nr:hypothetical protein [Leptolyngbya sp. NK1-12]WNZ24543.1 hypothetical protein HJG54_17910 [Leptolyngbya sp. NK1-12]